MRGLLRCGRSPSRPAGSRARITLRVRPDGRRLRMRNIHYSVREYPLQQGALEIAYIEEYFNEFPTRKTATEIMQRLDGREFQILMAEASLPDDSATVVPVSYKVSHELRPGEADPKLADLVARLQDSLEFDGQKILYNWLGATR